MDVLKMLGQKYFFCLNILGKNMFPNMFSAYKNAKALDFGLSNRAPEPTLSPRPLNRFKERVLFIRVP